MRISRRFVVLLPIFALVLSLSLTLAAKDKKKSKKDKETIAQMEEHQRALHALNRLTFGPRPGDMERVVAMGVDKWIDLQLHPEKIDDSPLDARLAPLRTLHMDSRAMLENFPPPQLIKAVLDGKVSLPSDPAKRAVYETQMLRYQERKDQKQGTTVPNPAPVDKPGAQDEMLDQTSRRDDRMRAQLTAQDIIELPAQQRFQAIMRMNPEDRLAMAQRLPEPQREKLLADFTPEQRDTIVAMANPQQVVIRELQEGKLLRALYSDRQLQEVMTDFWFNHFNVFIGKGAERYLITSYERDAIRPHAMGKFKDLLVATAKSPAMLFYLDNWMSVGPNSDLSLGVNRRADRGNTRQIVRPARGPFGRGPRIRIFGGYGRRFPYSAMAGGIRYALPPQQNNRVSQQQTQARQNAKRKRTGLNENYARELMELHTLGVNGGYTQKDVTEVARVFTGWTLREPRKSGDFEFNERMHEPGKKLVLGHEIKEHGEDEGTQVLEMLAHHPSTARFISTKLAERFVSDNPPVSLIDKMAKTFQEKDGDIREVLGTMFHSPEFWSADAYRAKVKTPLEFVVSAVRASGANVNNPMALAQNLNRMGMQLYGAQPPTGYSMKAETWVNSGALLNRMNFALALAGGRLPGLTFDPSLLLQTESVSQELKQGKYTVKAQPAAYPKDPNSALAALETALLAGDISRQTHETILKQLQDPQFAVRPQDNAGNVPGVNVNLIAGLILGSPEFQRR